MNHFGIDYYGLSQIFFRKLICKLPKIPKMLICDIIAITIYLPLSRISLIFNHFGFKVDRLPLSYYRNKSIYTMRTDSLDRFGTSYEKRYSKRNFKFIKSSWI